MKEIPVINEREGSELKKAIISSLSAQGFSVRDGKILPPEDLSKENLRKLHATAVEHKISKAKGGLIQKEPYLLQHIASGHEIVPDKILPRIIEVTPGSEEELLFRYTSLHWSIPVSSGYGRRLRFLVIDEHNNKLIGIIGLGDPVFSLKPRDKWVGWTISDRKLRLKNVMDAFVLGAVPPYSFILCGKLVAMLVASDTVRHAFMRKYAGSRSVIQGDKHDGQLAMVTTVSALGRSSIYNRLRLGDRLLYRSVGFTKGSGEFHFSNSLYGKISEFVRRHCHPTAKQDQWGTGFRNRREIIRKCLSLLGLSRDWIYHGIQREVFVVPLARNTREFLCGETSHLEWYHLSETDIYEFFRDRWMLPRLSWDKRLYSWSKEDWAIWVGKENGGVQHIFRFSSNSNGQENGQEVCQTW